jgi:hypothetical protein
MYVPHADDIVDRWLSYFTWRLAAEREQETADALYHRLFGCES